MVRPPDDPGLRDAAWAADVTYIPTAKGWLYLAVVLDQFSRGVVGWAAADHLRAELCTSAPETAPARRRPRAGPIHHRDRGCQYAGEAFRAALAGRDAVPSMIRKGDCWDNAVVESFFATLRKGLTHRESYATRDEARRSLFEHIEAFDNRTRLHSTLGYMSPADHEAADPTKPARAPTNRRELRPGVGGAPPQSRGGGEPDPVRELGIRSYGHEIGGLG